MNKIRILIADDNALNAQVLRDQLSEFEDFELVDIARDGLETVEFIDRYNPDVVLLDLIMPRLDGIGVLEVERSKVHEHKPTFIVFSAIRQESYISKAMSMGADYYIIKPFDVNIIASRIRQVYGDSLKTMYSKVSMSSQKTTTSVSKKSQDDELRLLATKYMREMGLKAHMTGYAYIREVIVHAFDYYCKNGSLPKGIYRTIAQVQNVSVEKVERAIRNCVDNCSGFDDNDKQVKKRPNSAIICELINKIREND